MGTNDTRRPPPDPGPNPRTRFMGIYMDARVGLDEARRAYAFAREFCEAVPATAPGYRLFWVHGRDVGWRDLAARGGAFVVAGRHDCCDVVLERDDEVSLRHLLATAFTLEDGTAALRLLDLHTTLPFFLDDGEPRRSIVVSGPVVVRLGTYVLGAMPVGDAALAFPAVPSELPVTSVQHATGVRAHAPRGDGVSHISILPRPSSLSEREPPAPPGQVPAQGAARITLQRAGRAASVELLDEDLDAGVLLGRYERCLDRGLHAVMDTNISRVHLLIQRERDGIYAYDLCSTQGTWVAGQAARRLRLPDTGATIELASEHPVTLTWHAR